MQKNKVPVRHYKKWIDAISQARTHNILFRATGGGHMMGKDVFLGLQKRKVEAEINKPKKQKDALMKMGDVEQRHM